MDTEFQTSFKKWKESSRLPFSNAVNIISEKRQNSDLNRPTESSWFMGGVVQVGSSLLRQRVQSWFTNSLSNDIMLNCMSFIISNTIMSGCQKLFNLILNKIRQRFMVNAVFDSRDETFDWLMDWIKEQDYGKYATDIAVVCSTDGKHLSSAVLDGASISEKGFSYIPSAGTHFFRYKQRPIFMNIEHNENTGSSRTRKMVTVTYFGWTRNLIDALLTEARALAIEKHRDFTVIYTNDAHGNWEKAVARKKREMSSVILANGLSEEIRSDALDFLQSGDWYRDRGIPYRRGYLLYGPPGNGKSSYISALGAYLDLNIFTLSVANPTLSDEKLCELLNTTSSKCIVLLEDIEYVFKNSKDMNGEISELQSSNVTFSGLLNAIDGVSAQEGRILVLTTNNIEKLANALIRPGRVDVRAFVDYATPAMICRMFQHFYKHIPATDDESKQFTTAVCKAFNYKQENQKGFELDFIKEDICGELVLTVKEPKSLPSYGEVKSESSFTKNNLKLSMANLQGHLMKYKQSPQLAIENAQQLVSYS